MRNKFDAKGQLTSMQLPPLIFRYYPPGTNLHSAIEDSYLWFSSLDDLNDPVESKNALSNDFSPSELYRFFRKFSSASRQEARRKTMEVFSSEISCKIFLDELHAANISPVNVCCFSRYTDVALMWSHYAAGHRGVCIGYNTYEVLKATGAGIVEVKYSDEIVPYNHIRSYHRYGRTDRRAYDFDQSVFGTKHSMWSYENEIRLISHRPGKHSIPRRAVVTAFFGCKSDWSLDSEMSDIGGDLQILHPHAWVTWLEQDRQTGIVEDADFNRTLLDKWVEVPASSFQLDRGASKKIEDLIKLRV